jgi:hypothetical protein
MNHNDNTSGYILSNYLGNIFHLYKRRPSPDPDASDPAEILLVCYYVLCLALIPNPDPRKKCPDPTRMIQQPFKTIQRLSWEIQMGLLCCVMCRNTPPV